MSKIVIRLLRVALAILLLGSVLAQVLVPAFASEAAKTFPEVGYLVVPYSVAGILVIACGQVALLVVWRLLSMIIGGVLFTPPPPPLPALGRHHHGLRSGGHGPERRRVDPPARRPRRRTGHHPLAGRQPGRRGGGRAPDDRHSRPARVGDRRPD